MAVTDLLNTQSIPGKTCYVCHALDTLNENASAILRAALANPMVRYSELSTELAADPIFQLDISPMNLSRHARGQCQAKERMR